MAFYFMKLSIITITFNAQQVIEKTIQSVLSQTYKNFEYLIIDGLSTDQTMQMVALYKSHISKIISEKDTGIYDAMNKGLSLASGEYVLFMNAGDCFKDEFVLENIFKNNSNADVYYGETEMMNEQGKSLGLRRLRAPKQLTWKSFQQGMLVCHQSIIIKRSIAPLYNLEYTISADIDWIIRCLQKAQKIENTQLVIAKFLMGGESNKKRWKGLKERFMINTKYYGFFSTIFFHIYIVLRFIVQVPFYRRVV